MVAQNTLRTSEENFKFIDAVDDINNDLWQIDVAYSLHAYAPYSKLPSYVTTRIRLETLEFNELENKIRKKLNFMGARRSTVFSPENHLT